MGRLTAKTRGASRAPSGRAGSRSRIVILAACAALGACNSTGGLKTADIEPEIGAAATMAAVTEAPAATHKIGQPYKVAGKTFVPRANPNYDTIGVASWYGDRFHGRPTANGERFDVDGLTAAHPTLPMPSYVRVTNLQNQRSVVVRVNDRGPFKDNRLIDVSERTAELLEFKHKGMARVRVQFVDLAPIEGEDESFLLASYRGPGMLPSSPRSATPNVMLAYAGQVREEPLPEARPAPTDAPALAAAPAAAEPAPVIATAADPAPAEPVQTASAVGPAPTAAQPAARKAVFAAAGAPFDFYRAVLMADRPIAPQPATFVQPEAPGLPVDRPSPAGWKSSFATEPAASSPALAAIDLNFR